MRGNNPVKEFIKPAGVPAGFIFFGHIGVFLQAKVYRDEGVVVCDRVVVLEFCAVGWYGW
jgi:hypothetical protein